MLDSMLIYGVPLSEDTNFDAQVEAFNPDTQLLEGPVWMLWSQCINRDGIYCEKFVIDDKPTYIVYKLSQKISFNSSCGKFFHSRIDTKVRWCDELLQFCMKHNLLINEYDIGWYHVKVNK